MTKTKETKTEKVRALLARPEGASLDAICKATGWQAHSARAALSGLRKRGAVIERIPARDDKGGGSVYRLISEPEGSA